MIVLWKGTGQLESFSIYVGVQQKQKDFFTLLRNLLYVEESDLDAHTFQHAQECINRPSASSNAFGMSNKLDKTVEMADEFSI